MNICSSRARITDRNCGSKTFSQSGHWNPEPRAMKRPAKSMLGEQVTTRPVVQSDGIKKNEFH